MWKIEHNCYQKNDVDFIHYEVPPSSKFTIFKLLSGSDKNNAVQFFCLHHVYLITQDELKDIFKFFFHFRGKYCAFWLYQKYSRIAELKEFVM
jgi:hypothetical protein